MFQKEPQFTNILTSAKHSSVAPSFVFFYSHSTSFHITESHSLALTCWCLVNIHLHTAVSHGHGIVGQGVTGHLAVVGAADRGEGAHVAGVERVSSLVRSEEGTTTDVRPTQTQRGETGSNRWGTCRLYSTRVGGQDRLQPLSF